MVEAVLIHPEIPRRIAEPQKSRCAGHARGYHQFATNGLTFRGRYLHTHSADLGRRVLSHGRNDQAGGPEKSFEVMG